MKIYHETINIDSYGSISDGFNFDDCVLIDVAQFNYFSENRRQRRHVQSLLVRELLDASLNNIFKQDIDNSWIFKKTESGKPFLNGKNAPSISVSHSGDWCACSVSKALLVGVDVEVIKPKNWEEYCTDVFHPEEAKWVLDAVGHERDVRGLICWCRKEAIVKALGVGLTIPLTKLGFSSEGVLIEIPKELGDSIGWNFFSKVILDEIVVAVAWKN